MKSGWKGARGRTVGAIVLAVSMLLAMAPAASAQVDLGCRGRNDTYEKLLRCVSAEGVREHLAAFQRIANDNGGTRASGLPGYEDSVDYVASTLRGAGWDVEVQDFVFDFFQIVEDPTLAQTAPDPTEYEVNAFTFSGSGTVEGTVQAVDVQIPPPATPGSTSGCEPADFAGFTPGNIALIQRGTCTFEVKAENAQAAGATAVIIFNEGQPGRTETLTGTLGRVFTLPVLGVSFEAGADLADPAGTEVALSVETTNEPRVTQNVIAESRRGDDDNVVMLGAHLDSVPEGPGINDNGSGSAALLELAQQLRRVRPVNTVKLAFWGAEEVGLLGSQYYVDNLTDAERRDIALYLNFDMVGSPNFVRFIYDGDQSDLPAPVGTPVPPGSAEIEETFEEFFASQGLATDPTDFDGRSDYEAFIFAGIPAGGLFTGAEEIKTPEQAAIYGGEAGVAYDPCYHQACDTLRNVNDEVLEQNADAIAYAALTFAFSTQDVNGVPGQPVPSRPGVGLRNDNGDGAPGRGAPQQRQDHDAAA